MQNYQWIKLSLLSEFLDGKSTSSVSHKLGYPFDQVRRWQQGSKHLRWNEFCDLSVKLKRPLFVALSSTFGFPVNRIQDAYGAIGHLRALCPSVGLAELADRLSVSASSMQRYLAGTSYPNVEFVLELMDQRSGFLDCFLEKLRASNERADHRTLLSIPWAAAVANAASLPEHLNQPEHAPAWIAKSLGLSERQVNEAIELMVALGLIERQGPHYGPTLSRTIAANRSSGSIEYSKFIRFWMKRSEARFATSDGEPVNKRKGPNKDAFRIFASGPESARKISKILVQAEQEIHDVLQQSKEEKTDVRVLLLHHFSAQDFLEEKSPKKP